MKKDPDDTQEFDELIDVTDKVKRLWYVDSKTHEIKKVEQYEGVLDKYDPSSFMVIDTLGNKIGLYRTFKLASIASLNLRLESKKEKWNSYSKKLISLNSEITDILDEIDKLNGIPSDDD